MCDFNGPQLAGRRSPLIAAGPRCWPTCRPRWQQLAAAGSSVANLVLVRVYVTDTEQWPAFNRIYQQWAGAAPPARAVVPVPLLHYGFLIEVEAMGVVGLLQN